MGESLDYPGGVKCDQQVSLQEESRERVDISRGEGNVRGWRQRLE